MTSIEEKISELPREEILKLNSQVKDILCDRHLCAIYKIDYVNFTLEDISRLREQVYTSNYSENRS